MSYLLKLKELEERALPLFSPGLKELVEDLMMAENYTVSDIYNQSKPECMAKMTATFQRLEKRIVALEAKKGSLCEVRKLVEPMSEDDRSKVIAFSVFLRFQRGGLKSIRDLNLKYHRPIHELIGLIIQGAFEYAWLKCKRVQEA